ncbi:putative multidrug efflux system, outer membrane subunit (efflux pump component) (TolC family) [Bradyrhizobium sp. ORS 278]|uniref:efflux transporter outer membrane subunit n=1 Tax=Bradyrhizobium sp. (strain ORS 278) TaxID=114615 RepID=UPI0001508092|nr:efflux transporter outer membrane subunit [Bradyrhizobium sp. ORS 278]CAL79353.1 putative multidrug efflux system, outer membrane subunit (efflux pump component) (TolC family) [Bradyrhizobium sp. ORS 278]
MLSPVKPVLLALCLASPLLAGCAVGPDYVTPDFGTPARWSSDRNQPAQQLRLAQWWRNLGDAPLDQLIGEAVSGNLDVAAAKARIREARATQRQAVGALFPTVSGTSSATETRSAGSTTAGIAIAPTTSSQFQAGFDSSWELDLFGANRRAVEAASYGVDAAKDDLRATLLTLIGDVASNYIDARAYQARVALAQRTAASQRETAALTARKQEAGSASAVDTAKASALAASTEATIPTYESSYQQALHRLGVLLGRDPTALSQRLSRSLPIPAPRRPLPKGIPADVLVMRPDIRKAERQLAQFTAKIGQATAALYPDISLTGTVSTSALKLGDLGKSSTIGWSIGPSLSVPIFNGGKLQAAVEVAEAQRDEYHVAWRSAVLSALEDVENAIVNLGQERLRIRSLTESARRYNEAARLSRGLYQTGSSTFLDVLDAERSQFTAEDSLLASRAALAKNYVALAKALGGGWSGPIDSSVPEVVDGGTGPHLAQAAAPR